MIRYSVGHGGYVLLAALLVACTSNPIPSTESPSQTTASPRDLVVTSALDGGPGSLRQALLDAEAGDVITFAPAVFPPDAPTAMSPRSELPHVIGNLTIDASDAGVILDGAQLPRGKFISGLVIDSDGSRIFGLQVINFPGPGIAIADGRNNAIGGERTTGAGPIGQGNLTSRNGTGIALWGSASGNVITGNLVGTDASGNQPLGNQAHGVWITEGAERNVLGPGNVIAYNGQSGVSLEDGAEGNTIGPENVIAYNGETGIMVDGPRSFRNTITRNSIHDNAATAIYLSADGNAGTMAPGVLDFDLAAGTVAGTACPRCTVEVFSDGGDQGTTYEGVTLADGFGVFALDAGRPLAGPHLTAVAIDAGGNTSPLSPPTSGPAQNTILQHGNDRARTAITIKPHDEQLTGSRIGDMWGMDRPQPPCPSPEEHWYVRQVLNYGFSWARLSIDPREWWYGNDVGGPRYDGPFSSFEINRCQDEIITELAERGITILLTVVYWDQRLHSDRPPNYGNEQEVRQYLRYVSVLARHFGNRVGYFEILNEPVFFVDLPDYLNLIRRVVPIIRREAPEARIVAGGGAYLLDPHSREYLFGLLRSDVVSSLDAIELHPMYGTSPQYEDTRRYYYRYPGLVGKIRKVARAHGFSGEILAEEMLWRTPRNAGAGQPWVYTPTTAAKYLLRAIVLHRGLGVWVGIDTPTDNLGIRGGSTIPSFFQTGPRLTTIMDSAEPADLAFHIDSEAEDIASYGLTLPNGDALLALWTDGVAVDDLARVTADITFQGAADAVVGLDALAGFQQELIASRTDGKLVLDDVVVPDYPIFLRLSGWRS
jgi:Right handed beta helix region